jgi:hypothetical protein
MLTRRIAIDIIPGARVRYLGNTIERPRDGSRLGPGSTGVVLKVVPPDPGTGLVLDGVEDDGSDGYAVIQWDGWHGNRLIHPDGEGTRWQRC